MRRSTIFNSAIGILTIAAIARALTFESPWINWASTHWIFTYEDGFIKRGLTGEILHLTNITINPDSISIIYYAICTAITVITLISIHKLATKLEHHHGIWLLGAIFATNPGTLQHIFYDFGRLDAVVILTSIISIYTLLKTHHPIAQALAILVTCITPLIHETALFVSTPLILATWLYRRQTTTSNSLVALAAIPSIAVTAYAFAFGTLDRARLDSDFIEKSLKYGNWVTKSSLDVIYKGGLMENIARAQKYGFTTERIWDHITLLAVVITPLLALASGYEKSHPDSKLSSRAKVLLGSSACPLLLYPVGHDHFRWWSLSLINLFIALAVIMTDNKATATAICEHLKTKRTLAIATIMISLIAGPLGATYSFRFY